MQERLVETLHNIQHHISHTKDQGWIIGLFILPWTIYASDSLSNGYNNAIVVLIQSMVTIFLVVKLDTLLPFSTFGLFVFGCTLEGILLLGRNAFDDRIESWIVISLFHILLYIILFVYLAKHIGKSFTLAELMITTQLIVYATGSSTQHYLVKGLEPEVQLLHFLCLVMACFMLLYCGVFVYNKTIGTLLVSPMLIALISRLGYVSEYLYYILAYRVVWNIVIYWASIGLLFAILFWFFIASSPSNILKRKSFHFLAVVLFIPAMMISPHFVRVSFGLALILFVILEFIRWQKVFGHKITELMTRYMGYVLNEKDQHGPIVLSHTYLLLGCSFPLLMAQEDIPLWQMSSGLLALGIGDSFASIIGTRFGRHRWSGGNKSLEGTLAAIISTSIAIYLIKTPQEYIYDLLISIISTFILEASTDHIDNLLLPIFLHGLLSIRIKELGHV